MGGGGGGGPKFFCPDKKNGEKFHFFNFRKFLIKQTNIYQIPKCHTFLESSLHLVSRNQKKKLKKTSSGGQRWHLSRCITFGGDIVFNQEYARYGAKFKLKWNEVSNF